MNSRDLAPAPSTEPRLPEAVPGLFDVEIHRAAEDSAPWILFEVPHGATRADHYEALRGRLKSELPDDLEAFFHVNTDIGAPEVATATSRLLAEQGTAHAVVLRCLVPRTFIDCNRALEHPGAGAVTPGIPDYVTDSADREHLIGLHRAYTAAAEAAYRFVCGRHGGFALNLHTFAPRSIAITEVKSSIVDELRAAYQPEVYPTWPMRPEVDLITRTAGDQLLAPEALADSVRHELEGAGFQVAANQTYRLFQATMGFWHSRRHPDRVLCVELRRDLLAETFRPFEAMTIADQKVAAFAGPLSRAVTAVLG